MTDTVLDLLWTVTATTSVAVLLVMLLRPVFHALLQARAAYALWLLVPAALLGALLPTRVRQVELPAADTLSAMLPDLTASVHATVSASATVAPPETAWTFNGPLILTVIWLAGTLVHLLSAILRQHRFMRLLGVLAVDTSSGAFVASKVPTPMVTGLWTPRILLPADFTTRFTPEQRELILAHEQIHLARRDLPANALAALLCACFWFNPLMHIARRLFLRDQEWACDALVLARFPHQRRAYSEALLSVHAAVPGLPVACAWQSSQPLVRRIRMIRNANLSPRMAGWGNAAALVLGLVALPLAWAAQPERIEWVEASATADVPVSETEARISAGPSAWPKAVPQPEIDVRTGSQVRTTPAQLAAPAPRTASRSTPDPLPLPDLSGPDAGMQLASLQTGPSSGMRIAGLAGGQGDEHEQLPLVMEPTLLRSHQPRWPAGVKFRNFRSAAVLVEHSVTPAGEVVDIVVLDSTDPRVNDLAVSAVKRTKFAPIEGIGRYPEGMRVRQAVVWEDAKFANNGVDPVGPVRLNRGNGVPSHVEVNAGRGR